MRDSKPRDAGIACQRLPVRARLRAKNYPESPLTIFPLSKTTRRSPTLPANVARIYRVFSMGLQCDSQ
jgi:hypothetical protein